MRAHGTFRSKLRVVLLAAGAALFAAAGSGCGYSFQHARNPLLERYGIRRIYVSPLRNNTYKPGVENLVYNELVRVISANRRVVLVPRMEDADAVLTGAVTRANYTNAGGTTANALFPTNDKFPWVPQVSRSIIVATAYSANLECSFHLGAQDKAAKKPELWGASFSRNKTFPGNNQVGSFGTTSSLINESEFDRALSEMARNMMADVHESMLAMF